MNRVSGILTALEVLWANDKNYYNSIELSILVSQIQWSYPLFPYHNLNSCKLILIPFKLIYYSIVVFNTEISAFVYYLIKVNPLPMVAAFIWITFFISSLLNFSGKSQQHLTKEFLLLSCQLKPFAFVNRFLDIHTYTDR